MTATTRTLILLLTVTLLSSCGGQTDTPDAPASQAATPGPATPDTDRASDTNGFHELPANTDDPTVWGQRDAPPAGVRSQVEYFGIGDGICLSDPATPELSFIRLPWYHNYEKGADDPELGETLVLCANGFSPSENVDFNVEGPEGFVLDESAEAKGSTPYHAVMPWLTSDWPIGEYTAVARQGDAEATLDFKVVPPTRNGVRVDHDADDTPKKEPIDAMLIGHPPNSDVDVDIYRLGRRYYEYATSVVVATDSDGLAMFRLRVDDDDSGNYMLMARDTVGEVDPDSMALVGVCCE